MAFGVELPDNIGSPGASTPDAAAAPEGAAPETVSTKVPGSETPITDLDKLDRFRFEGREWKKDELRQAYLRQQDYTKKTQELAETRKYADNFAIDLRKVIQDRQLLGELRRIYPKEFADRAEEILRNLPDKTPQDPSQKPKDPEIESLKGEFQKLQEERKAQQIEQIEAWLESQRQLLSKKYEFANMELVEARAEIMARQGHKITAEVLDKLAKTNDSEVKAKWDALYQGKVKTQLKAGKEGKDLGPGGGVPTEAPKKFRTIKEATNAILEDIQASKGAR